MKTVLLPVKDFKLAKQRLAPVLSPARRAGLARAMLSDVLRSLATARLPDRVVVYTGSEAVAELVRPYSFDIVEELFVSGHSAAVNRMVEDLADHASQILSIAADLPTLRPEDVDGVFEMASADINIIPSRDGTGTNAALFRMPARIKMQYGEGSLKRHLAAAAERGLKASVLHIPGIEFDVDTPEDLQEYLARVADGSATWEFLMKIR